MLEFDNPGHIRELRKFGILGEEATSIEEEEYALRAIALGQISGGLMVLEQELKTASSLLPFIENMVQTAHAHADAISDQQSCDEARTRLNDLDTTLWKASVHKPRIELCVGKFIARRGERRFREAYTEEAKGYMASIRACLVQIEQEISQANIPDIMRRITGLERRIEENCRTVGAA